MAPKNDMTLGLDQRIIEKSNSESMALSIAFLVLYISLGALGRDVLFNRNIDPNVDDPIGAILPYIRVAASFFAIFVVVASSGLTWALSKVPLMFAPFCAYALLTSLWTDDIKDTVRAALTLTAAWIAMPMIIHRIGLERAVRLSLHLIAAVCIASFLLAVLVPSIGTHTGGELFEKAHAGRWRGIFSHKNGLAPWAAYGSVFLLAYGHLLRASQLYVWIARVAALCCIAFVGSATAIILVGALWIGWASMVALRHYTASKVLTALVVLGIVGAGVMMVGSDLLFALIGRDSSLSGRTDIWQFAWNYIYDRIWTGYGYATLGGKEFLTMENARFLQPIPGPESGYLTLTIESGLFGVILFFGPLFVSIRNGFEWLKYVSLRERECIEVLLLVLLSTLIEGFSESGAFISTGYDGVIAFSAFFALLTTPKSPESVRRKDFRLAKYWQKPLASRS